MKQIILAIVFMIEGEPHFIDGYLPRTQPDMETCEMRREFMLDYFAENPEKHAVGGIYCGPKSGVLIWMKTFIEGENA